MASEALAQPNFLAEFSETLNGLRDRLIGGRGVDVDRRWWDRLAQVGRQWWQIDRPGFQEALKRQLDWSKAESALVAKLFGVSGVKQEDKWNWLHDALEELRSQISGRPSRVEEKIGGAILKVQGESVDESNGGQGKSEGEWGDVPAGKEPLPERPKEEVEREEKKLERIRQEEQVEPGKKAEKQISRRRFLELVLITAAVYTFLGPKGLPNPGMDVLKWLANLKEESRDLQINLGGEEWGDDRDPQLARVRDWVREWGRPKLEADYISTRNSMLNVLEGNGDLKREVEFFNEAGKEGDWQQQVVMREGWEHAFWRSLKPAVNNDGIFSEAEMEAIEGQLIQSGVSSEEVEEFMSVLQESNKFQIK